MGVNQCSADASVLHPPHREPTISTDSDQASDRAVLELLYDATGCPGWCNSTDWKTAAPIADWHGLVTELRQAVTGLFLSENDLTKRDPP